MESVFHLVKVEKSKWDPTLLQSAKADYAALNLHCCRDTCHIRLGGKGNAWLEVFGLCKYFMHSLYVPLQQRQWGKTQESMLPFQLPLRPGKLSLSLCDKSQLSFLICAHFTNAYAFLWTISISWVMGWSDKAIWKSTRYKKERQLLWIILWSDAAVDVSRNVTLRRLEKTLIRECKTHFSKLTSHIVAILQNSPTINVQLFWLLLLLKPFMFVCLGWVVQSRRKKDAIRKCQFIMIKNAL